MSPDTESLAGADQMELEQLHSQHLVWRDFTERFLNRLHVGTGWKCLDVGSGPGYVAMDILQRVGPSGHVTLLEPSTLFLDWFRAKAGREQWKNVDLVQGTVEGAKMPRGKYDLIFVRLVLSFVSNPENFLVRLFQLLRKGGVLAVQDYFYEGLSLFPRGGIWDRMPDVIRRYYESAGGNPYVTGSLPSFFRRYGLKLVDFQPNVLTGRPGTPAFEWADSFFALHTPRMVERGLISQPEGDALIADWNDHKNNPDAIFFSPIVLDVAGEKE